MFNFLRKANGVDIKAILEAADAAVEYTPDMWRLNRYEWQRLFVPDEMQRGFYRYPLIQEDSFFRARGFTEESYVMYKKKLGEATYAITLPGPVFNDPIAHIGGQVHYVRPHVFKELDRLKLNGLHFERKRVSILVPFREQVTNRTAGHERVRRANAWMYVGIPDYWVPQLDGGYLFDRVKKFNCKSKFVSDYYLFSKLEYDK